MITSLEITATTVKMPLKLHRALKHYKALKNKTINDICNAAISEYIETSDVADKIKKLLRGGE